MAVSLKSIYASVAGIIRKRWEAKKQLVADQNNRIDTIIRELTGIRESENLTGEALLRKAEIRIEANKDLFKDINRPQSGINTVIAFAAARGEDITNLPQLYPAMARCIRGMYDTDQLSTSKLDTQTASATLYKEKYISLHTTCKELVDEIKRQSSINTELRGTINSVLDYYAELVRSLEVLRTRMLQEATERHTIIKMDSKASMAKLKELQKQIDTFNVEIQKIQNDTQAKVDAAEAKRQAAETEAMNANKRAMEIVAKANESHAASSAKFADAFTSIGNNMGGKPKGGNNQNRGNGNNTPTPTPPANPAPAPATT